MKKICFLIFFFLINLLCYSQNEASNWYFGFGSGLHFDLARGTLITNDSGQLSTNEGCATISDNNGALLFYTDGSTIWNSNHAIMSNGRDLFGDSSSTQSAIIVPKPDDPDIYYVFTVDNALDGINHGLNYSIINMALDGGLGRVTSKNINLLQECSEKVTAVLKDCRDKSIWVVTFASETGSPGPFDTYHAFEVNDRGLSTTAIKSTFPISITDLRGYLKLSPDGTKLASANSRGGLFLYDFDTNTGIVSWQRELTINSQNFSSYGVEFSPNSQLLYVHSSNDLFGNTSNDPANHSASLTQFDLSVADIQGSEFEIDNRQLYRGGLQLGPDGKIYRALSATYNQGLPYLGVIQNPNGIGSASNYSHRAINLSPNNSSQGLPPFIQSLFATQIDIIQNGESTISLILCEDDTYRLVSEDILRATYTWTRDGILLANNTFDLIVSQGGHYEVLINPNNGDCEIEGQAFVSFNPKPEVSSTTILQCDEDGMLDGRTQFSLDEAINSLTNNLAANKSVYFYLNPLDAENNNFANALDGTNFSNTSNPQTIYVSVINNITGCSNTTELTLDVSLTDSSDTELSTCDDDGLEDGFYTFNLSSADSSIVLGLPLGLSISYFEAYEDALLENNELGVTFTNTVPYNQTIYARVENANDCYGISEVALTVYKLPDINPELLTYYCLNTFPQNISLDADVIDSLPEDYNYTWSTGETTYEIQVNQIGDYSVVVTNANGCSKERNIKIEASNTATINSIEITDATQNNIINVIVSGEGIYNYALFNENGMITPFQTSNTFENVFPGIYSVHVRDIKNNCGTVQDLVSVIGFPKFFTPNNDGHHDTWQVSGVSNMFQPNSKILIYNRYGKLIKQLSPLKKGWDGSHNGKILPNDDYWFAVTLQDGRIFTNHFTLKR